MEPIISNLIVIILLVAIILLAAKSSIAHFKGQGACCGGGGTTKKIRPQKLDTVVDKKVIRIEGMVCDRCSERIHNALNSIQGINAKVERKKGRAIVKLGCEMDEEKLRNVITDLGYRVLDIQ